MMLHFAYGSNMSRPLMAVRCPSAEPLGKALLPGWRYTITHDGYASIVPTRGGAVHGTVWRLMPRDLAALNAYEDLHSGLYRRQMLTIHLGGKRATALAYVGRDRGPGRPQLGYQEVVLAAAHDWGFPERYLAELARWSPSVRLRAGLATDARP
jgi:gamma-glutamylcyclotransferase (GGCT)/AIG2-like uncharacterized protein YtfP